MIKNGLQMQYLLGGFVHYPVVRIHRDGSCTITTTTYVHERGTQEKCLGVDCTRCTNATK